MKARDDSRSPSRASRAPSALALVAAVVFVFMLVLCGPAGAQEPEATPLAEPAAGADPLTLFALRDGRTLWGTLVEHGPEDLGIVRLDNGGRVQLPWSFLDPLQELRLRERFGYVDRSEEEVWIEGDRIVLDDGRDVIGLIVGRTETELVVKARGRVLPVPKLRVRGATRVRVPALDVYSREELYARELARQAPGDAAGHVEMARFCERILDFEHALEHYRQARALDAGVLADIDQAVVRAERKAADQSRIEELHEIDSLRARGRYDEALERAAAFQEMHDDSPLLVDARRRAERIERERERRLREETVRGWHRWAGRVAASASRSMTHTEALAYLGGSFSEDVLAGLTEELQRRVSASVTADDVRRFWDERDLRRSRVHKASYGAGTWLLGEERARAGIEVREVAEKEPATEKDAERDRLEEKIRRYLENQSRVQRSKARAGEADDHQSFWAAWNNGARTQWILAHYAEHSGDMVARGATFTSCHDCGGTGVRRILHLTAGVRRPDQSNEEVRACPACHHIGVFRRVAYR